jgi:hypothetical protein
MSWKAPFPMVKHKLGSKEGTNLEFRSHFFIFKLFGDSSRRGVNSLGKVTFFKLMAR